jgi:Predicted lipoprotein of unknown function (DUF2380)
MLPQQFRKWFADYGIPNIDIPEWTMCLPKNCHTGAGGVHSTQDDIPGTNWNALWAQWIAQNPNATPDDIRRFLDQLKNMFRQQLECK